MPGGIDALYRLTVNFSLHGNQCQQTTWARAKETDPLPNLQAACDKLIADWYTFVWPRYKVMTSNQLKLDSAVAQCLNPPGQAQSIQSYTTDFGSVNSDALPSFAAAVLGLYTPYPGRRTHGRLYIPGMPEGNHSGGIWDSVALFGLKNLGDTLIGNYGWNGNSPNYWWGVYSRKNGAVRLPGPPPTITYSPLTLIPWSRHVVNSKLGTQRHRLNGRGV